MKKQTRKADFYSFYESQTNEQGAHASFQRKKKQSPWVRVALTLFVGLVATSAWFGYLFFSGRSGGSADPLEVTVDAPHVAENGSLVEYRLTYANRGRDAVPDGALFAEYPIGFTFVQSDPTPENTKKNYWNIGSVPAGGTGEIHISGTLSGLENEERTALFSLQYTHPLYRSSFFIKREAKTVMQPARADTLSMTGPQTINAGDTADITIRYQDVSKLGNPERIILALTLPDGVTIEKAVPELSDSEKKEWNGFSLSKTINPDAHGGSLLLSLKFADTLQGAVPLAVRLLLRDASAGADSQLRDATYQANVLRSDLSFVLHAADTDTLGAVRLGVPQRYVLEYTNKGNILFKNISIRLSSVSGVINWSTSSFEKATIDQSTVTWNSQTNADLQELKSGETKRLAFALGTVDFEHLGTSASELTDGIPFAIDANIGMREESDGKTLTEPLEIVGPRISLPILSDARARAFVRDVSSGDANQKTFRVYMAVTHSIHDLDDIELHATLPASVAWSALNSRTAGDIAYSSENRRVTWKLNTLPASVKRIDGSFDITVPASGLSADTHIVENVTLNARDRQTGTIIMQKIEALTGLQTEDAL